MRRGALRAVAVFLAVVLQLTIVDRLPLPGGSAPDIVLLLVVALGLTQGPVTGALTGFLAGIGLDLAPPATHPIGESAFVFCLVGYGCGWLGGRLNSGTARLLAAGIGTATGAVLQAAAGRIAGDPDVTASAVRHVLPPAVLYDVLLMPVVLLLVTATSRPPVRRGPRAWPALRTGTAARARRGRGQRIGVYR